METPIVLAAVPACAFEAGADEDDDEEDDDPPLDEQAASAAAITAAASSEREFFKSLSSSESHRRGFTLRRPGAFARAIYPQAVAHGCERCGETDRV